MSKRVSGIFFVLEDDQLQKIRVDTGEVKKTQQQLLKEVEERKKGVKIPNEIKKELIKEFQKILDQI